MSTYLKFFKINNFLKLKFSQDEASAATSSAEHQQPETSEPSRTSTMNRKQPDRFGEPIPTNLLKKGGRM